MKTRVKSNRTLLVAGAFGRSVVALRLKTQTSGCLVATPIWEVLK